MKWEAGPAAEPTGPAPRSCGPPPGSERLGTPGEAQSYRDLSMHSACGSSSLSAPAGCGAEPLAWRPFTGLSAPPPAPMASQGLGSGAEWAAHLPGPGASAAMQGHLSWGLFRKAQARPQENGRRLSAASRPGAGRASRLTWGLPLVTGLHPGRSPGPPSPQQPCGGPSPLWGRSEAEVPSLLPRLHSQGRPGRLPVQGRQGPGCPRLSGGLGPLWSTHLLKRSPSWSRGLEARPGPIAVAFQRGLGKPSRSFVFPLRARDCTGGQPGPRVGSGPRGAGPTSCELGLSWEAARPSLACGPSR